jgi:hypothetical protein
MAIAAIADETLPALTQIGERGEMRVDEVGHLDVVAQALSRR